MSRHRQAVDDPGSLAVAALADDSVIEGVYDPDRPFYLGVQWHPERTDNDALGQACFDALVAAIRSTERSRTAQRPDATPTPASP